MTPAHDRVELRVWGWPVRLTGFPPGEVAEVHDTFAGSVTAVAGGAGSPVLDLRREWSEVAAGTWPIRPRHRGGSAARKFFLDGTPFVAEDQHRDVAVVAEGPAMDVYHAPGAAVMVRGNQVTISAARALPALLLSDVIEDWLLCRARAVSAVQGHCSGWLGSGVGSVMILSSR